VPAPLANQAGTSANLNEVPQSIKAPLAVLIKAVEDALEIPLFVTTWDRIRVEVSP
jgi:hypothetical protein